MTWLIILAVVWFVSGLVSVVIVAKCLGKISLTEVIGCALLGPIGVRIGLVTLIEVVSDDIIIWKRK